MGKANFIDAFERGAVVQTTERGYPVGWRLGWALANTRAKSEGNGKAGICTAGA